MLKGSELLSQDRDDRSSSPKSRRERLSQAGPTDERRSVAIPAVLFAIGTLLSRVLGLFRDVLIARYLSPDVRDAFLNAFRLPNLFRRVFGEGALSASFIPVHVDLLESDPVRARRLRAAIFSILFSLTSMTSLLAIVFMEDVMRFLLSGEVYMNVPGKFELTVRLARIMFAFLVAISLFGYFMAVLNSFRKFATAAFASCVFNLVVIIAAKVSRGSGAQEFALAWAILFGGFLQMATLIPGMIKAGVLPRFSWDWQSADTAHVLKSVLPAILGVSVPQLAVLINMRFAAGLEAGAHAYLYLADRILELPLSLFVVSVGSALLPTLSRQWASGDKKEMSETINHYMRLIVFVAWPAALGLFILAQPICEMLFLGREFKYQDVLATASVIRIYAFVVVLSAGVRILAQGFFAIQNAWYPAVAGTVALIAHFIFAFALTRTFRLEGLAAASIASAFVNLMMLAVAYNAWVGTLELRRLAKSFGLYLLCGAAMVVAIQAYGPLHQLLSGRFRGGRETALLLTIAFAIFVYFSVAHFLKIAEFRETWSTLSLKLRERIRVLRG